MEPEMNSGGETEKPGFAASMCELILDYICSCCLKDDDNSLSHVKELMEIGIMVNPDFGKEVYAHLLHRIKRNLPLKDCLPYTKKFAQCGAILFPTTKVVGENQEKSSIQIIKHI